MNPRIKKLKEYGFDTGHNTYIIAELGINHGGDIDKAKRLIDSAAKTGVDAVKFQTYQTEKRAPRGNQAVFDILKECELPFEAFRALKDHTIKYKMDFVSTPFDKESVEYLESIECNIFKVASFDIVNHKLLNEVAMTGKPVLVSVGMANHEEIEKAYSILKKGTDRIALLHCISAYPTNENDVNLACLYTLKDVFDCVIGYSDHTNNTIASLYAVAAGAQIIEKHFKIDENMKCVDEAVSIDETQMKQMVSNVRKIERMIGSGEFGIREVEKDTSIFRRPTAL